LRTVPQASQTFKSDDGIVTLVIPEGALPDDVAAEDIKITKDDPSKFFTAEDGEEYFYKLEPDGLKLKSPATITYEIKAGQDYSSPLLFNISEDEDRLWFDIVEKQATVIDPEKDTMEVSSEISHFSWSYLNRSVSFAKFTPNSETTKHKVGDQFYYNGKYTMLKDKEYTFTDNWGYKTVYYVNKDEYSRWDLNGGELETGHRFIIMPDTKEIDSYRNLNMNQPYSFLASFKCEKAGDEEIRPTNWGLETISVSYYVYLRLFDKKGKEYFYDWSDEGKYHSEVLSVPERHYCEAAEEKKEGGEGGGATGGETKPPAEKPGLTLTGDNYRLVCSDGKVYTGAIAKCPIKHVPIKDSKGNYTDSKTGKAIVCP